MLPFMHVAYLRGLLCGTVPEWARLPDVRLRLWSSDSGSLYMLFLVLWRAKTCAADSVDGFTDCLGLVLSQPEVSC